MTDLTDWQKAHHAAKVFSDRHYRDQKVWIVTECITRITVYGEDDSLMVEMAKSSEGARLTILVESYPGVIKFTALEAWAIVQSIDSC